MALAAAFPEVRFIAVGQAQYAAWDAALRQRYAGLPNLEMPGLIDQFTSTRLFEILDESWISVNTATREGLPNAFFEAGAHRCAILSNNDPDGFASRFGWHVTDGDSTRGLATLLEGDLWRERGERGFRHVAQTLATEVAIARHIAWYEHILAQPRRGHGAAAPA